MSVNNCDKFKKNYERKTALWALFDIKTEEVARVVQSRPIVFAAYWTSAALILFNRIWIAFWIQACIANSKNVKCVLQK